MEVKKIVEGMTAPQVAQVIDENFNALNNEKATVEAVADVQKNVNRSDDNTGVLSYPEYSSTEPVAVGDVRRYEGLLYSAKEAGAYDWDPEKWERVTLKQLEDEKISELGSEVNINSVELGREIINPNGQNGLFLNEGIVEKKTENILTYLKVFSGQSVRIYSINGSLRYGFSTTLPKLGTVTESYAISDPNIVRTIDVENDGYIVASVFSGEIIYSLNNTIKDKLLNLSAGLSNLSEKKLDKRSNSITFRNSVVCKDLEYNKKAETERILSNFCVEGNEFKKNDNTSILMYNVGLNTQFRLDGVLHGNESMYAVCLASKTANTDDNDIIGLLPVLNGEYYLTAETDGEHPYVYLIVDNDTSANLSVVEISDFIVKKTDILEETKNLCIWEKCLKESFLNSNGDHRSNSSYCVTDYIPISSDIGSLCSSVDGVANKSGSGCVIAYDSDKNFIKSLGTLDQTGGIATWEEGFSYVRFSINNESSDKVQVEKGIKVSNFVPPYMIKESYISDYIPQKVDKLNPIVRIDAILSSGGTKTSNVINYIKKNNVLTASIKSEGEFDSVTFGLGKSTRGYWVTITETNAVITSNQDNVSETIEHGMTIGTHLNAIVDIGNECKGKLILQSNGISKSLDISKWIGGGPLFVENSGTSVKEVQASLYSRDLNCDIWGYGDSYFSFNTNERWTYYLMTKWGYTNLLLDHLPGAKSATMYTALLNDLNLGKPKYIFWALGMNDSSDTDVVDSTWLGYVSNVLELCNKNNITPILCTIPSIPSKSHELKNQWVRSSGYRYVDFANAVGAQADGIWYEGLLGGDNVHPTPKGAQALASQAVCDFPELTN